MERTDQETNKQLIIRHFEDFVNNKDLAAIDRNMSDDFYDHDGPGGIPIDRAGDKEMMAAIHKTFPDLKVEIADIIAENNKVIVRNIWIGTHAETGKRMEFHGFVFWIIQQGKIVERWSTVTSPKELKTEKLVW